VCEQDLDVADVRVRASQTDQVTEAIEEYVRVVGVKKRLGRQAEIARTCCGIAVDDGARGISGTVDSIRANAGRDGFTTYGAHAFHQRKDKLLIAPSAARAGNPHRGFARRDYADRRFDRIENRRGRREPPRSRITRLAVDGIFELEDLITQ